MDNNSEKMRINDYYVCVVKNHLYPRFNECKCFGPYNSFINADNASDMIMKKEKEVATIVEKPRFLPKIFLQYLISHELCPKTKISTFESDK